MRERWGAVVVLATIPLAMLAVDPAGWHPFGPSKWLVISVLLTGGSALLFSGRPVRSSRPLGIVLAAFVGWMALASIVGVEPLYAWTGTPERRLGIVTWLLCVLALFAGQSLDADRDRRVIVGSLIVAGVGVGSVAVAEAAGWEPALLDVTTGRLTATMGSAAFLGAVTAILLPALVGFVADRDLGQRTRAVSLVAAVAIGATCVGAGARASWFGLAVAAVVTLVARRRTIFRRRVRAAAVGGATVLGLAVLLLLTPMGGRLAQATDSGAAGGRSRVDEWRVATAVMARHPVFGVGPEGYRIAFAEGVDDAYEQAYGRDPAPDRAHSAPLDLAVTGGIPALVAWLGVIGLVTTAAVRALRDRRLWLAGIGAAWVAHLAGQLLLFPTAELEPIMWLLGGVLVGAAARSTARSMLRERVVPTLAVAGLAVVALVFAIAGWREIGADRLALQSTEASSGGDHEMARRDARAAVDLRPDEVRLHLLLAQSLVAAQRPTATAIETLDDALAISPSDPIVRRHRARLLVQRAGATFLPVDIGAARRDLDELLASDGSNAALWLLSGTTARLEGDPRAAEAAFLRAEVLAPRSASASVELASLFLDTGRNEDARRAAGRAVEREPTNPDALAMRERASGAP